jgi:hypothetical protein
MPLIIKELKGKILDGFSFLIIPYNNEPPLNFLEININIY